MTDQPTLAGRTAVVTGVSRRRGIGFAVASRLADMGASLALHHHAPHDLAEYGESDDVSALHDEVRARLRSGARLATLSGDLGDPALPERVIADARAELGHLDILACNQAHGGDEVSIRDATADAFDRHWAVNARATLLLTQAFADQHDERRGGRVVWMTSGQQLGPMSDNLAYATSKAALAGAVASVAADLVSANITLNAVNPGPVNTGYMDGAPPEALDYFPLGRFGEPDDPARLIGWLVSDDGEWMVGQVLNTEGGFRR